LISIKTVEMHMANAYRKLGARSRAELPGLLASEQIIRDLAQARPHSARCCVSM
jgi:hypothetical protein